MSEHSPRRLQRNRRRRRLGGVCAGIADYLQVQALWIRLAFVVSLFFSFSLSFWAYILLWILLPARPETAMPEVRGPVRRELHQIDRLVRSAHRKLPSQTADAVQDAFNALKVVAGELQSAQGPHSAVQTAWDQARTQLPRLIRRLLSTGGEEPGLEALREVERALRATSRQALSEALSNQPGTGANAARFRQWKDDMSERAARLARQAGPQARAVFKRIEEKLAFLLTQTQKPGEVFDLNPFNVERIAFEYLPQALDEYLKLPQDMAQNQQLQGGVTAEDSLNEQLVRLDHALENLASSLFERDAQGLLINGRFLRERFADEPFRLPGKAT